jgi:hypothetical protein
MYYPLSQITPNLYTNGNEFVIDGTQQVYTGYYFKTSKGQFYTGKTSSDKPNQLLVPLSQEFNSTITTPSTTPGFIALEYDGRKIAYASRPDIVLDIEKQPIGDPNEKPFNVTLDENLIITINYYFGIGILSYVVYDNLKSKLLGLLVCLILYFSIKYLQTIYPQNVPNSVIMNNINALIMFISIAFCMYYFNIINIINIASICTS